MNSKGLKGVTRSEGLPSLNLSGRTLSGKEEETRSHKRTPITLILSGVGSEFSRDGRVLLLLLLTSQVALSSVS